METITTPLPNKEGKEGETSYSPYFNPEAETMPREQLEQLQLERLQKTVNHCMNSPFYQKRFQELGITPADIKTLDDVRKLPFTTKEDLRDNYPFGICCVPMKDCVRLHSSSGTTGNPTVVLHSQKDLEEWATAVARCLWMVGSRPEDVFQNSAGYGMFTAGLGFQYGAEKVGMLTVPAAAGNTTRQIKFIKDFGTTVLHAIPSYASRVFEVMQQEGVDPRKDTKLRVLCIGAEPHSEEQRKRIEDNLGVKAYNSYGISEMMGPGVAFECQEQNGLHIWEDYFIVEIIDPVTLEPVPDGELGELVLTTINREAMPLLRYRTRDLTRILPGDCPCGRHHKRLARLQGRSDDMIILKGVNIFPIQIEKILLKFKELSTDYLITLETKESGDTMTIDVELSQLFTDDYKRLQALEKNITRLLKDEILITPKVRLVSKGTLTVSDEKKAVRVKDLRKLF
ncbi:MAG: phenylacetate--CoA ligase [Prevotella sp.]|nr:phenylacetate--CoA ligase [Prevotella sp.]MBR4368212.1 phenylacetate--CoA ligase [Prevotella sp.]MBR7048450.1 phenylacetate--CoA ligase [Prevotella sp.]